MKKYWREITIAVLFFLNCAQLYNFSSIRVKVVGVEVELQKALAVNEKLEDENSKLKQDNEFLYAAILRQEEETATALRVREPSRMPAAIDAAAALQEIQEIQVGSPAQ